MGLELYPPSLFYLDISTQEEDTRANLEIAIVGFDTKQIIHVEIFVKLLLSVMLSTYME